MTITTKQGQDDDRAQYSAQFDGPEPEKKAQSEDEAFGITPEPAGAAPADDSAPAAAADASATASAPNPPADKEQELAEREQALAARSAELDQREAAMATSNVNEQQTSKPAGEDESEKREKEGDGDDPEAALAEDFGPEFVSLLKRLIHKVCAEGVQSGIGGLSETIQRVIDDLNRKHVKAIKRAHDDFVDIVESPEFTSWKDSLPETDKADVQDVIDAGSAEEIIDMLSKFKASKQVDQPSSGANDDEVDAAAGVRSGGLKLPPEQAADEDYATAWAKA